MIRKRHLASKEISSLAACGRVEVVIVHDWREVTCRDCQRTTDFFLTSVHDNRLREWRAHFGPLTGQLG
jgi:hypothetical protein